MTTRQKIELRLSKVRERLNIIAGLEGDALTEEIAEEAETLQTEYGQLEVRQRAAIVAEGEAEQAAVGLFPDGGDSDGGGATGADRAGDVWAITWDRLRPVPGSVVRRPS